MTINLSDDDEQLRYICDYGAGRQLEDPHILPLFQIMPCEISVVRQYMAEKHPGIRYMMDYPTGGNTQHGR